ncbi:MAG TPA: nicotinamide riboside transporter PnuC [Woeseiaceae bacterium]|nr:nicotinamide riboside transporter PnuC [Woeseiaceae bacterium]
MDGLPDRIAAQFHALGPAEAIAVIAAVAYLLLAIRRNIWCWFFAAVSTAIYIALFIGAKLYMESLLNVFYLAMALYGWHVWRSGGERHGELPVTRWPLPAHAAAIAAIAAAASVTGFLLDRYSDAAFPYADSATTIAAIWTTFLVARKVLENWWYWLAIDSVSIYLYWARGLQLTALLFVLYVALIPVGIVAWRRAYAEHQRAAAA